MIHIIQDDATSDISSDDSDYRTSDHEPATDEDENFSDSEMQEFSSEEKKKKLFKKTGLSFTQNVPGQSSCADTNLTVDQSRGRAGDKKTNFCVFCHKQQSKIGRHLQTMHKDQAKVQKFINLPKKSFCIAAEKRKLSVEYESRT